MFEMSELAVAVPNALPQIKSLADTVIQDQGIEPCEGFEKFLNDLINRRQPTYRQRPERRLVLGYTSEEAPVYLDPLMLVDSRIGIFGASSSGKSWLAGLITEELFKKGYQFCIVDPEGDYRGVASSTHGLSINVTDEYVPSISELMNFMEWHGANMVVDMSARICHLQYQSAQDRKRVRDFCIRYQDRLLYGTDVGDSGNSDPDRFRKSMHETWLDDWKYFTSDDEMTSDKFRGTFTGLMLPKEVVDKIYNKNAVKWYKLNL